VTACAAASLPSYTPPVTAPRPLYLGIDLGTTNSAAAVFDGEQLEIVRNAQGATITPSVVRIDGRGNVLVGERARRMIDRDPENVRTEFKRLMGTKHVLRFPASGVDKRPADLSAEVLRAIRDDVRGQVGVVPACAVISVPALFELPQTTATSEAARLAGFDRVEMIQEPVASAIAAGWKAESEGPWLVYDLGGGTFDVSLLETQDGLLRVVGHDGDNFLGGRDFDAAIVDWAIEELAARSAVHLSRAEPAHATALRRLRLAAEEAKIELTRTREAELLVSGLEAGGAPVDVSLVLDRPTLERITEPLVLRTIALCHRLLATHGIVPRQGALSRVVLVGGPTAMPMVRAKAAEMLGAPFAERLDPMTLVAQGAALYAASAGLDARASAAPKAAPNHGVKVWLQYPAMSSDPSPYVVGKLVDPADRSRVAKIVVRNATADAWTSEPELLDAEGTFAVMVRLKPRTPNSLAIEGRDERDVPVPLAPETFTIVHGLTIGDPPLARSIGVALATGRVHVYFERGSPLPMRRTFGLRTVEALSPQDPLGTLRIPIVQGEFALANLCRLVGVLEIAARDLAAPLAAQSLVEVTVDVDRGGRLSASARVHDTAQMFDQVAQLVTATLSVAEVGSRLSELARTLHATRSRAFQRGARSAIEKLGAADGLLVQAHRDEEAARGGDLDALEKVRRILVDLDALVAEAEEDLAWPDLQERIVRRVGVATGWVADLGTPEERRVLATAVAAVDKARVAKNPQEVERHLSVIVHLGTAAYFRSEGAWARELDALAGRLSQASDPRLATRLVEEGRAAMARRDNGAIERSVRGLWPLFPDVPIEGATSHGSGVGGL
jgi:molecular chaperone DnaK